MHALPLMVTPAKRTLGAVTGAAKTLHSRIRYRMTNDMPERPTPDPAAPRRIPFATGGGTDLPAYTGAGGGGPKAGAVRPAAGAFAPPAGSRRWRMARSPR